MEAARKLAEAREQVRALSVRMESLVLAAEETVAEARRIHENNPAPQKYRAPYAGLVKLENALAALSATEVIP